MVIDTNTLICLEMLLMGKCMCANKQLSVNMCPIFPHVLPWYCKILSVWPENIYYEWNLNKDIHIKILILIKKKCNIITLPDLLSVSLASMHPLNFSFSIVSDLLKHLTISVQLKSANESDFHSFSPRDVRLSSSEHSRFRHLASELSWIEAWRVTVAVPA